jgi:hypothetical protein
MKSLNCFNGRNTFSKKVCEESGAVGFEKTSIFDTAFLLKTVVRSWSNHIRLSPFGTSIGHESDLGLFEGLTFNAYFVTSDLSTNFCGQTSSDLSQTCSDPGQARSFNEVQPSTCDG